MKAWEKFVSSLSQELGSSVTDRWLKPLRVVRFDAGNLFLEADDPMQITWFEEHVRPRLKRGFFNENHRPIKVHLGSLKQTNHKPPINPNLSFVSDPLDPFCTLENFRVTPENRMIYKLLTEWAGAGSSVFNPIFLYGPKGSGKTHLLMSAALIAERWNKKWFFVSADTFTEHVVQAIRSSRIQEFRAVYRELDVLIIDNIDHLSNRTATQEEFFHTFNALHSQGKLIILSSSLPPSKLKEIEFRLISRFEWGLPIGMEKADPKKVLEAKAHAWKLSLTDELSHFLLEQFKDPITSLQALGLRTGTNIPSKAAAEQILADLIRKEQANSLTPEKILKSLAAHFGITADDILGKGQAKEFAFPRQIGMYLCRKKLKLPYQKIGALFGRDHSTVMASVKQIQQGIERKETGILEAVKTASNE